MYRMLFEASVSDLAKVESRHQQHKQTSAQHEMIWASTMSWGTVCYTNIIACPASQASHIWEGQKDLRQFANGIQVKKAARQIAGVIQLKEACRQIICHCTTAAQIMLRTMLCEIVLYLPEQVPSSQRSKQYARWSHSNAPQWHSTHSGLSQSHM